MSPETFDRRLRRLFRRVEGRNPNSDHEMDRWWGEVSGYSWRTTEQCRSGANTVTLRAERVLVLAEKLADARKRIRELEAQRADELDAVLTRRGNPFVGIRPPEANGVTPAPKGPQHGPAGGIATSRDNDDRYARRMGGRG